VGVLTLDEFIVRRSGDREPLFNFQWYCMGLPFGGEADYVETINLPFPSLNMKPVFGAGIYAQFAGFQEISAFDITFHEDVSLRTRKWLAGWLSLIRNQDTGAYGLPSAYKRDISIALYSGRGPTKDQAVKPVARATLLNCWPVQSGPWDLTNTGAEALKVQQNFATDGMRLII